jgi:hypothetical protein
MTAEGMVVAPTIGHILLIFWIFGLYVLLPKTRPFSFLYLYSINFYLIFCTISHDFARAVRPVRPAVFAVA